MSGGNSVGCYGHHDSNPRSAFQEHLHKLEGQLPDLRICPIVDSVIGGMKNVYRVRCGITIDLKNRRLGLPGSKPLESSYRCSAYLQSGLAGRLRSRLELARLEG